MMPELRLNIATQEWVVIAPERARRPEDHRTVQRELTSERPDHRADCPFCIGSEDRTPGETLCYEGEQGWLVRSVPNRYPALTPGQREPRRRGDRFHSSMEGIGRHEVVIESPTHNATLALQSVFEVALVLRAWRERYRLLSQQPGVEHVVIFKNHGAAAGTSLEHPHSQIVSLPVLPAQVRHRLDEAARIYHENGQCVFCKMLSKERRSGERIIKESRHFTALVPFAASSPYCLWLFPNRHHHSYAQLNDEEMGDLADLLRDVLRRLYFGLSDPPYNLVLRSAHPHSLSSPLFHFYLTVVPRLGRTAGFELGTGMFINPSRPEKDADFLRNLTLPPDREQPSLVALSKNYTKDPLIAVIDEQGHSLPAQTRSEVRRRNLLHRTVAVIIRNRQGEVFVHQRAAEKDYFPNFYSLFVTGMVGAEESYLEAARRKLGREVQLKHRMNHPFCSATCRAWICIFEVEMEELIPLGEVAWSGWVCQADLWNWIQRVPVTPVSLDCYFALQSEGGSFPQQSGFS